MHPAAVDNHTDPRSELDDNLVEHIDVDHDGDDDDDVHRPRRPAGPRAHRPAADGVDEHLVDVHVDDQHELDEHHIHLVVHDIVVDDAAVAHSVGRDDRRI